VTDTVPPPEYPQIESIHDFANARLMGERILVRRYPLVGATAGGLILPDAAKENRALAWVVKIGDAVGNAAHGNLPAHFLTGDTILFAVHDLQPLPELGFNEDKQPAYGILHAEDIIFVYRCNP
jgi:co-chaperonin GroES (HSP10)